MSNDTYQLRSDVVRQVTLALQKAIDTLIEETDCTGGEIIASLGAMYAVVIGTELDARLTADDLELDGDEGEELDPARN